MSDKLTLSIDAMGGDDAPSMVIDGLKLAIEKDDTLRFILHGDEAQLVALLADKPALKDRCEIRHTDVAIPAEMKAPQAVRQGKKSSMWQAILSVRAKEAEGVVSAGNTGALMALSKMILKTLPGIHRPAIIALLPTESGLVVMLDLGGNTECTARNLVEFAVMGEVYARSIFNIEKPSVALLNIGSEDMKGREEIREAAAVIKDSQLALDFRGFVEGHDIGKGGVDVIVTDGFTGNVALKTVEGTAKLMSFFLKKAFRSTLLSRLGYLFAYGPLKKVKKMMDPRLYNGAMFIGLNGISVKSHGGTDALGFSVAVKQAATLARKNVLTHIRDEITHINGMLQDAPEQE